MTLDARVSHPTSRDNRMSGEIGVWLFVLGDMVLFAILFLSYAHDYALAPEVFRKGQAQLNPFFGVANTLLLLIGSFAVALAVQEARGRGRKYLEYLLYVAIGTGVLFLINKAVEYTREIGLGHTMVSDSFFMYYYTLTMIHLMHVSVGIGVLVFMVVIYRMRGPSDRFANKLESGGLIWHMVDLLWIALFPLLYLIRI